MQKSENADIPVVRWFHIFAIYEVSTFSERKKTRFPANKMESRHYLKILVLLWGSKERNSMATNVKYSERLNEEKYKGPSEGWSVN